MAKYAYTILLMRLFGFLIILLKNPMKKKDGFGSYT